MTNMSLFRQNADGAVYADPNAPDCTVRFKTTSAPKSLNGQKTTNYITEVIINDDVNVTVGGNPVVDQVSIRIRVSGSKESQTRIASLLAAYAAQLPGWSGEHVFIGFTPATPPVSV